MNESSGASTEGAGRAKNGSRKCASEIDRGFAPTAAIGPTAAAIGLGLAAIRLERAVTGLESAAIRLKSAANAPECLTVARKHLNIRPKSLTGEPKRAAVGVREPTVCLEWAAVGPPMA